MEQIIKNKVAESALQTISLEQFLPLKGDFVAFDIAPLLFKGLILKEKDFRNSLLEYNWNDFEGKNVAVFCSTDAIIPMWAYMLIASYLNGVVQRCYFGSLDELYNSVLLEKIRTINLDEYKDGLVIVKGCGNKPIPALAYVEITNLLRPIVKSLMFGEACSTVPVYKKKKK